MAVQITKYKMTTWLNRETNGPKYGVKVYVVGQGWVDVAEDGKGVFFDTPGEAKAEIKRMKAERDRSGWKIVRAA